MAYICWLIFDTVDWVVVCLFCTPDVSKGKSSKTTPLRDRMFFILPYLVENWEMPLVLPTYKLNSLVVSKCPV